MAKKPQTAEHQLPQRELYPRDETRRILGDISNVTLHKLFNAGKLKPVKIGRRTFVTGAEIRRYVAELEAAK